MKAIKQGGTWFHDSTQGALYIAVIFLLSAELAHAQRLVIEAGLGQLVTGPHASFRTIDSGRDTTEHAKGIFRAAVEWKHASIGWWHFSSIESARDVGGDLVYGSVRWTWPK